MLNCPDPIRLHHVMTMDNDASVRVLVDSIEIFSLACDSISTGTVGFGAGDTTGSAPDYIPMYDNLTYYPEN